MTDIFYSTLRKKDFCNNKFLQICELPVAHLIVKFHSDNYSFFDGPS